MLVSRPIPNLFSGVSQQPASLRHPTQCEVMDNAFPSIATGTRKRPPTIHKAKLSGALSSDTYVHYINRDETNRYVVVIAPSGGLSVYDLATGAAHTVSFPDGTAYFTSATPRQDIVAVTAVDYTFITNKTVTVKMLDDRTGVAVTPVAISSITRASSTATVTTGAAHNLATGDWVGITGAAQAEYNGWFQVTVTGATTFTYTVTGTPVTPATGTPVYTAIKGSVTGTKQRFSDLPTTPATNDTYLIQGDPSNSFANYYVRWNGSVWVECAKPGVKFKLDAATMPWRLTQTGTTTWECRKITWADRLVGDDTSNPQPSFVGDSIRDIFYFRGRLGMISGENVILSRATDPFNFFAQSVTAVLDSDPVDRSVTHTKVSVLHSVVPFNKTLMLFSDQTQFQLTAGDVLTPKTPKVDPVTEFEAAKLCRPVGAGSSLYFAVDRAGSTAIREYSVASDSVTNDADDVTAHVPTYIPKDCFKIASCTSEDTLFVLSLTQRNMVWVYKFFWKNDTEKAQSAWCRYVFDADDVILGAEFVGNTAHFVISRADGVYLESLSLQANATDGNLGFLVNLDRRVSLTGVYDAGNDWTTWTLPYEEDAPMTLVLGDAFGTDAANALSTTRPTTTTIRATGRWDAGACYIGRNYTMRYRFSTIYLREASSSVSVTNGSLKLRRMFLNYDQSGYFRVEVTPRNRGMYTYEFTGKTVGGAVVGTTSILTGTFKFPVMCENVDATIDVVSDSYLPCIVQSAEWEGEFVIKAQRSI